MAIRAVGLDIGSTALRGVELKAGKKGKISLRRFHEVPLPVGAVVCGEVVEPEIVALALKRLWTDGGFKNKKVVLGTGNQRIMVRDVTVPKMSLKHIRESLPLQVQNMLQVPLEDALLDFYPVAESAGENGESIEGLLIAAEKREILGNIRVAERADLTPVEVDLIPFALNRLLVHRPHLNGSVALIDVGGHTTSITITNHGVPLFVRIIPAGGEDLTRALMSELEIESEKAEILKRVLTYASTSASENESSLTTSECACARCSAEFANSNDSRSRAILQSVTGELLNSLRSTVNYFNNTRPQDMVLQILLTGGGAQLGGFALSLSEITHIPVTTADPFTSITLSSKLKGENLHECGSSLVVALALALRG
jgi:type IV pilus assembly protein PilM